MTRYEIRRNYAEIKKVEDIVLSCTLDQMEQEPEIVASFEDKAEALEALKGYTSTVKEFSGGAGKFYGVTEYYVEENKYDEDGEWIDGGDIWKYSEFDDDLMSRLMMTEKIDYHWEAIAMSMDDEKREQVHNELAPCENEEFLKRYCEVDPDFEDLLKIEFSIELD